MTNRVIEEDGIKYFKCRKCGEIKPLNKCYFHINTMFSTGFNSKCKSCVKEERDSKPKVKYVTRDELLEENRKLKEEVRFLEECLDRKEKLNEKLREELSAYDREYFDEDKKAKNIFKEDDTYVYDAKQVRDVC